MVTMVMICSRKGVGARNSHRWMLEKIKRTFPNCKTPCGNIFLHSITEYSSPGNVAKLLFITRRNMHWRSHTAYTFLICNSKH